MDSIKDRRNHRAGSLTAEAPGSPGMQTPQCSGVGGLDRRRLLQAAGFGVGALGLASCGPLSSGENGDGGADADGPAEIGVKPAEGTSGYDFLVGVGDGVTEENPDFTYTYTFVNTKVRPQIEQRWRAGDPPDLDYEIFNAQVPSTHDFAENLLDLTPYMEDEVEGGGTWGESFLEAVEKETVLDGKTYGVLSDTAVIALFYAVGYWNSFFNALLYINDQEKYPIQLVLRQYLINNQQVGVDIDLAGELPPPQPALQMAILVVSLIPIACVYPFLQKHFTKGMLTGAVKG